MVISLPGGMLATLLLATADVGCSKVRLEANAGMLEEGTQVFVGIVDPDGADDATTLRPASSL